MSSNDSANLENTEDKYSSEKYKEVNDPNDFAIQIASNDYGAERYDRFGKPIVKGGKDHKLTFADQFKGGALLHVLEVTNFKKYNSPYVQ